MARRTVTHHWFVSVEFPRPERLATGSVKAQSGIANDSIEAVLQAADVGLLACDKRLGNAPPTRAPVNALSPAFVSRSFRPFSFVESGNAT